MFRPFRAEAERNEIPRALPWASMVRPFGAKIRRKVRLKIEEPEMVYKGGKPVAVILPLTHYGELLE